MHIIGSDFSCSFVNFILAQPVISVLSKTRSVQNVLSVVNELTIVGVKDGSQRRNNQKVE